jgi:hypothetical protein
MRLLKPFRAAADDRFVARTRRAFDSRLGNLLAATGALSLLCLAWGIRELLQLR